MTPKLLADRYEVGRLLGAGDMTQVFEGWDRMMTRRVAIKLVNAPVMAQPSAFQRFQREAKAAAGLSHPNIVSLYDVGVHDRSVFVVSELVEGYTLRDRLRFGPLPAPAVVEVATQVCAALSAAHEQGVLHRDVTPGNIMLTPTGRVKVMDFGAARGHAGETMTQSGMQIGSAQYLAPEQAEGAPVDARSDLYSLGCCLYEMLTGEVPFTGESPVGIALQHVREEPRPPSELNEDVPPVLERITLRALAKRPAERWQTAHELGEALERGDPGPAMAGTALLPEAAAMGARAPGMGGTGTMPGGPPPGSRSPGMPGEPWQPPGGPAGRVPAAVSLPPSRQISRAPSRGSGLAWKVAAGALLIIVGATTGAAALLRDSDPPPEELEAIPGAVTPTTAAQQTAATAPPTTLAQAAPQQAQLQPPPATEAPQVTQPPETVQPVEPVPEPEAPGVGVEDGTGEAPATAPDGQVTVPDLVGLTGDEARAAITAAGLAVNTVGIPTEVQEFVGTVIVQRPQAGTALDPGGQVFLGIGVAPS